MGQPDLAFDKNDDFFSLFSTWLIILKDISSRIQGTYETLSYVLPSEYWEETTNNELELEMATWPTSSMHKIMHCIVAAIDAEFKVKMIIS